MQHCAEMGEDYGHSLHWGINPPPSETLPLFFAKPPPLNLQSVQAPSFRQFPPIYWFFLNPLPTNRIFQ